MAAKPSPRNHRNNPYVLDGFAAAAAHQRGRSLVAAAHRSDRPGHPGGAYFGLYRALSGSFIAAAVVLAVIITAC